MPSAILLVADAMSTTLRILDAASNRAREALRVMEDVTRFGLDSPALSADLKAARHDLQAALGALGLDPRLLLESRDTPGDVGTAISTRAEASRPDLPSVAAAASGRLTEALRTMEEMAKLLGSGGSPLATPAPPAWQALEALRYRAYELQRRLLLALRPAAPQWRLCVLLTASLCTHHPWDVVATRALAGGADCLQLREKSIEAGDLLRRARHLVALARPHNATVIINDRPDIALLAGADGVHLGQADLPPDEVRCLSSRPDRRLLIGVSCSTLAHARAAASAGADYLGLGPMFPSGTKPKPALAGPELIQSVVADPVASRLPHLAISGITIRTIGPLIAAGCRGVAVSGAVCGAEDPEAVVRQLLGEAPADQS